MLMSTPTPGGSRPCLTATISSYSLAMFPTHLASHAGKEVQKSILCSWQSRPLGHTRCPWARPALRGPGGRPRADLLKAQPAAAEARASEEAASVPQLNAI